MSKGWTSWNWSTCPGGVTSAVTPELVPQSQYAWGFNVAVRGGKPHTRPPFVERPCGLPRGLHQTSSYFSVQGGMIVTSIAGNLYRIRIGENVYSWEPIPLEFRNSAILPMAWMQQTVETLVIQDGQSNAILYNGSTARRAGPTEVPRGRQMAYGNGRLWVAINKNELVAGDIRQRTAGSELFFTETNYLSGGGALYFSRGITGMQFMPVTGAADFGTLIVFGSDNCESIRADVTTRDQWGMPGFVTNVFRDIGASGAWGIAQVNQDLYWRDSHGNIRSLANAISTNNSPGSTPISREVSRLVAYDSDSLLPWVSAVYFDNRLLMTSSPYLNISGGVSFKDIVALDFSPISTMQLKAPPAYDGQWTGIPGIAQIVTGQFNGVNRAFVISSDEEGTNRLWEIEPEGTGLHDEALTCGSGIITESRIKSYIEYPSVNFSQEKIRKRLDRCDVWLSGIDGELDLKVYWRPDNNQQWTAWDEEVEVCAKTTDAAINTPHTWKNLLPEQRPQIKSFTIPDGVDAVTKYALQNGFYHQLRITWTGKCRVEKVMLHAQYLDDPDFANRETITPLCIENNVTDNEITYQIPTSSGYLTVSPLEDFDTTGVEGEGFTPSSAVYNLRNYSEITFDWVAVVSDDWLDVDVQSGTLEPGQSVDVTISITEEADELSQGEHIGTVLFENTTNECGNTTITVNLTATNEFPGESIMFLQYDGPFVYPPCATAFNDRYYLTESADGQNALKTAPVGGDPRTKSCEVGPGLFDATGRILTDWSGESTYDMDCNPTGDLQVSVQRSGGMGAYDFPGVPGTEDILTGGSVAELFAQLPGHRATFIANQYEQYNGENYATVTRRWSNPQAAVGFFSGQFGDGYSSIWCTGYVMTSVLSDPVTIEDLAIPLARSGPVGSPAQTQTMHEFNGTTRTHEGNMSRAQITVPVDDSHPLLTGEFTYLVTPDVGDPYTLIQVKDFPITGPILVGLVDFPLIADAIVTMTHWSYSYSQSFFEEFSGYADGEVFELNISPSWRFPITFDAPPPNTSAWDTLEDFPVAPTQITTNPLGARWPGPATFIGVDYVDCYDDFEGYPVGETFSYTGGVGWNGGGGSAVATYTSAWDDFESYDVGTITVLDFHDFNNKWSNTQLGSFLESVYPDAWDDFESYSTGTITVFNYTSTDNLWDGNGRSFV